MATSPEKLQEELCNMIMRQTNYTEDETIEKLKEHNNNYMQVIKEYMCADTENKIEEKPKDKSVNQEIYSQIRHLMDDAASSYRIKKENEEKRALYQEYLQNKYAQMQKDKQATEALEKISEESNATSEESNASDDANITCNVVIATSTDISSNAC
jgi:hypothetical protein